MKIAKNILSLSLLLSGACYAADTKVQAAPTVQANQSVKAAMKTAENVKVCFVDSPKIMMESPEGKKETEKLQAKFKQFSDELQKLQKALADAANAWKAKEATANEQTRDAEQKKLVKMEREYKARAEECDTEFRQMQQKAAETVAKANDAVITAYAREKGFDAAICKVTGRVIYASDATDRTADVLVAMNKTKANVAPAAAKKAVA